MLHTEVDSGPHVVVCCISVSGPCYKAFGQGNKRWRIRTAIIGTFDLIFPKSDVELVKSTKLATDIIMCRGDIIHRI
jgi:hypothetical protein